MKLSANLRPLSALQRSRLSCRNVPRGGAISLVRAFSSGPAPVDLHYDQLVPADGNKKEGPLVILHGLFGSKRNWQSMSKAFLKTLNRPIYTLDLRNSGSSPHAEPMTYPAMVADVVHFIKKHSLRDVSLLGHSMGGKVAMSCALHPDLPNGLLSHLVVADISPVKGDISTEFRGYVEAMKKIEASNVPTRKEAQHILEAYEKDPAVRAFLLTNLDTAHHHAHQALRFKVPLSILDAAITDIGSFPYEPGERQWLGKTLFIKGSKSKYINRHNIPLAKNFFPNMSLETLEGGHWIHAENPHGFKDLVAKFVSLR